MTMQEVQVRNLAAEVRNLQMQVQQLISNTSKDEELRYGQPNRIGAYALFVGAIIPYQGVLTDLPDNWQECDGTNGTPDLRGRTVIGANGTYTVDTNYGAATVTPSAHTGTDVSAHAGAAVSAHAGANVSAHSGTAVANHNAHQHTTSGLTVQSGLGADPANHADTGNPLSALTHSVTQPSDHTITQPNNHTVTQPSNHTITQPSDHSALSTIQPSRALYWIMRLT